MENLTLLLTAANFVDNIPESDMPKITVLTVFKSLTIKTPYNLIIKADI